MDKDYGEITKNNCTGTQDHHVLIMKSINEVKTSYKKVMELKNKILGDKNLMDDEQPITEASLESVLKDTPIILNDVATALRNEVEEINKILFG